MRPRASEWLSLRRQASGGDGGRGQGRARHRQRRLAVPDPARAQGWQLAFDTAAGREEILFRRIGRNELRSIQACLAYVDAQQEYAEKGFAGNGVYAQRIVSQPGKKDGLYWPAQAREDESPLGELAAVRQRRAIASASSAFLTTATTTGCSPGRGRARPAARSTTWCAAR